jgi:hypothetical protein
MAHRRIWGTQVEEQRQRFWRRHRALMWTVVTAGVVLAAVGITLAVAARHLEPFLRAQIVAELEARFHTRVELDQFHVSVHEGQEAMWGIWADGKGLRIWPPQRSGDNPPAETAANSTPLIELSEFSFHVPLRYRQTKTLRIPEVRLAGLKIVLPPKPERDQKAQIEAAITPPPESPRGILQKVVVERVVCRGAELELETANPAKLPLTFSIQTITLTHLAQGKPMDFDAELTNARPHGLIRTRGSFGPWVVDDPGASAVSGNYRFDKANLAEFKGIAGTLSSKGKYDGTLRDIAVTGSADVPNFSLTNFGAPEDLETSFHARVNGTDGDTYLDEVEARLNQSRFHLAGKVVRVRIDANGRQIPVRMSTEAEPARIGHLIQMKIDVSSGKIEDFLRLVSKSGTPPMTGGVKVRASLEIPPGKQPAPNRMKLDGQFTLDDARFTSQTVQSRMEDLSLRGQGKPGAVKDTAPQVVAATMNGTFQMANGVVTLPDLEYEVPGAHVSLRGTYSLDGTLHFDGIARMQATVSQMVGGWKGLLLKPADRFFRKNGAGTQVPIKVRGTRDHPDFSVDLGKIGDVHP